MNLGLENKRVLVTGSTGGIGEHRRRYCQMFRPGRRNGPH
jgi:FlaA1/EpsC-like NDP-sugar epimerase